VWSSLYTCNAPCCMQVASELTAGSNHYCGTGKRLDAFYDYIVDKTCSFVYLWNFGILSTWF
jgi:hypothetical protein